jgi:hypothetical protein
MSPEQINGAASVDARTDVYAAGIVLFEAVTGIPPFAGSTLYELMHAHLELPPQPPRQLRPELPAELEQVILRAMAKAPEERYADAGAMEQALAHVAVFLPPQTWRPRARRVSAAAIGNLNTVPSSGMQPQPLPLPQPLPQPIPQPTAAPTVSTRGGNKLVIGAVTLVALAGIAAVAGVFALKARDEVAMRPPPREAKPSGVTLIETSEQPAAPPPALDYTPSHFDPIAYLPTAQALARTLLPDAELTEFEMYEDVWSDGHVDLTLPASDASYYEFRSPSASARAPGRPLNTPQERRCYVMVDVTAHGAAARYRTDTECDHATHAAPHCKLADVWKLAIADGEPHEDVVATIAYLHFSDKPWFFDLHHADRAPDAQVHSYPDCR